MIRVESVTKRYGRVTAVDAVSFGIDRNEIVGFVGPNGAGKSTMLRMLATYLAPTSGAITIDGLDAVRDARAIRSRIGYLPGDTPLYPAMRVRGFLEFVGRARGLRSRALAAAIDRVTVTCDIAPVLSKRVNACSTGYRQRIGLAAALLHDPPILLLDEPTHGFDPLQVMSFRDLLRTLQQGRSILFSTHIIQDVEDVSDRVMIIHEGRLLATGTLAELGERAGAPGERLEPVFAQLVRAGRSPA